MKANFGFLGFLVAGALMVAHPDALHSHASHPANHTHALHTLHAHAGQHMHAIHDAHASHPASHLLSSEHAGHIHPVDSLS